MRVLQGGVFLAAPCIVLYSYCIFVLFSRLGYNYIHTYLVLMICYLQLCQSHCLQHLLRLRELRELQQLNLMDMLFNINKLQRRRVVGACFDVKYNVIISPHRNAQNGVTLTVVQQSTYRSISLLITVVPRFSKNILKVE